MPTISAVDLVRSLQALAQQDGDGPPAPRRPQDMQARVLTDALREYMEPCQFERGDLVVIRKKGEGMGPGPWRDHGFVFMVAARLPPSSPLATAAEGYNIQARLFDMLLLVQDDDGDLGLIRAESRHFKKYEGDIA